MILKMLGNEVRTALRRSGRLEAVDAFLPSLLAGSTLPAENEPRYDVGQESPPKIRRAHRPSALTGPGIRRRAAADSSEAGFDYHLVTGERRHAAKPLASYAGP